MSSLIRRIERQVAPSRKIHPVLDPETGEPTGKFYANPPRGKFYGNAPGIGGRGSRLKVEKIEA